MSYQENRPAAPFAVCAEGRGRGEQEQLRLAEGLVPAGLAPDSEGEGFPSAPSAGRGRAGGLAAPPDDEGYMRMALDEARRAAGLGEVPVGAVVVYEPVDPATRRSLAAPLVIARACNLRETERDPSAHAEFVALRKAAAYLGSWRLTGCTVFVTLEPCIMCAGLMYQARIDRCVYGAIDPKGGALGSLYAINEDTRLNHAFEAVPGVLGDDCAAELRSFFACRRKKRSPDGPFEGDGGQARTG